MLIALVGKAGAGKNTVSDYICTKLNSTTEIAFADPIKAGLSTMFGLSVKTLDTMKNNNILLHDISVRSMYQQIGHALRDLNENIYIELTTNRIDHLLKSVDTIIVTDCRYVNEIQGLKSYCDKNNCHFITIYIDRKDTSRPMNNNEQQHVSETEIDSTKEYCLYTINNNSDLNNLYTQIDIILKRIKDKI